MGTYPLGLGGEAGGDSVGDLLQEGGRREKGAGDVGLGPCAGGRWKCWRTCHAEMVGGVTDNDGEGCGWHWDWDSHNPVRKVSLPKKLGEIGGHLRRPKDGWGSWQTGLCNGRNGGGITVRNG